MKTEDLVAAIVASNGGELVGRTRFQKTVYILSELGLPTNFEFYYHQFGPFSDDLSFAIDVAKAENLLKEEERRRDTDRILYSVFSVIAIERVRADALKFVEPFSNAVRSLAAKTPTVLELAASAQYLKKNGYPVDWEAEVMRRKGRKTEGGRMAEAKELLRELRLD